MNDMRKLMEMVEAGEYGSVPTSNNDVEIDGQGIILYEDQVAIYDEAGEYQIFLPIETWKAFVKAGGDVVESITEAEKDPLRSDPDDPPSPFETDKALGKQAQRRAGMNKDGYRVLIKNLVIPSVEEGKYKVEAVDYDATINKFAEADGVRISWYNHERNETVYIHIDDLRAILNSVEGEL